MTDVQQNIKLFYKKCRYENRFVWIAICHHLTSIMMPNSDPGDRLPGTQTQSYNISTVNVCLYSNLLMILHVDDSVVTRTIRNTISPKHRYVSSVIF